MRFSRVGAKGTSPFSHQQGNTPLCYHKEEEGEGKKQCRRGPQLERGKNALHDFVASRQKKGKKRKKAIGSCVDKDAESDGIGGGGRVG